MKTRLLKKLTMVVAFFAAITMSAQQGPTLYNFTGDAQVWVKGYGAGTVAHDPTGGSAGDGALTLAREGNGNANIRRGQGGDDAFIVLDRAVYNFIKIKFKNETAATTFRIQGNSRASGGTGLGTTFPNMATGIGAESGGYIVTYVDISAIPVGNEVTRLDILVRDNNLVDPVGSLVIFDEIEFLAALPPTTYSEFIQNPSFDGPTGIDHYTGGTPVASRAISADEFHDGTQSLKYVYDADATTNYWAFSQFEKTYASKWPANSDIQVKMWVKTNRTEAMTLQVRLKLLDGITEVTKPDAIVNTTNFVGGWELLTFDMQNVDEFNGAVIWFGLLFADETGGAVAENLNAGDVVYIDHMTTTITAPALSVDNNTLEGVAVYPNPVSETLSVKSPAGSDIQIYNILGGTIKSIKKANALQNISVSELRSGLYFVKITNNGKVFQDKIIKK
jgi:hypothetical protein